MTEEVRVLTPEQIAGNIDRCENCDVSELMADLRATDDDCLLCKECWDELFPKALVDQRWGVR